MLNLFICTIDRMLICYMRSRFSEKRWEKKYFAAVAWLYKLASFLFFFYRKDRERTVRTRLAMIFDICVGKEKRLAAFGKVEGLDNPLPKEQSNEQEK